MSGIFLPDRAYCVPEGMAVKEMRNRTFILWIVGIVVVFGILFFALGNRGGSRETPQTGEDVAAQLSQPFDAKATIRMEDLVLTADVNRTAPGQLCLAVSEPASLSGMQFAYDGEEITVSYRGLSVRLDDDSILVTSLVKIIVSAIDKASSPSGVNVAVEGDALVVSGESDSGQFDIRLDKANGSIASLHLPELDFECRFDDFAYAK